MQNPVSFQKTEDTQKSLPNFYKQPSKNEPLHLIQIYKFKMCVVQKILPFSDCLCPRKYTVKKYQRCRAKGSLDLYSKNKHHFSRQQFVENMASLETSNTERWKITNLPKIRCILRFIFPRMIFKDKISILEMQCIS